MKKYSLTMILLIMVIVFSIYYAFFRNNEVEVNIEKSKYFVQQRFRNIDLDKIPLNLKIEVENILKQNNTLELKKAWSSELNFDLTMKPYFDLDNLYLISLDKIIVYNKNNNAIRWKEQLQNKIIHFEFLDRNKILVCDDSLNFFSINRNNGETFWTTQFHELILPALNQNLNPVFISNLEDQRINQSILIVPKKKSLSILKVESGQVVSITNLESDILYISDYDRIDNCLYVVSGGKLIKFKLENS